MRRDPSRRLSLSIAWLVLPVLLALVGCVATAPTDETLSGPLPIAPGQGVDDFVLVDCLLPGQIRQLGSRMTYLAPRRSVKTTKTDCGIRGGEFVLFDRSDYASARQALTPKAQGGDPVAQTYLGEIYENGLGLPAPDYASAAVWYRKAAEQNHGPAQTNLGSLYERGLGVTQDQAQALDWYRRALGLTEDRLIFESTLKAQQAAFKREIAVRNQIAAGLRQQLRKASATQVGAPKPRQSAATASPASLQRQAVSQRLDAESEAARIGKELNAVKQLKQSASGGGKSGDSGKSAQLGKLELTRNEQYRALLDTSRLLAQQ